jgi:hypothetical protein
LLYISKRKVGAPPLIQYQLNTIATLRLPTAEGSAAISMARHYVQQM